MAKQLLGKEVTAALNEKIMGQVAELKAKGIEPVSYTHLAYLLPGIRRAGALRRSLQPADQRCRRTFRSDFLGSRQVLRKHHREVHPGVRYREQDQEPYSGSSWKGCRIKGRSGSKASWLEHRSRTY